MPEMRVKTTTKSDADRVIDVITLAFSAEPAARYTYPTAPLYMTNWSALVKAFADKAFEFGTASYIDDFKGAALWLPPNAHPDEEEMGALLQRTVPEERQGEVFATLEQMGNAHPEEAHWYLPMIGIDPAYQRKGYGTVLMQHSLARCDQDGGLAYLDCSDPANLAFYQQHGFEVIKEIQVGAGPRIYPMLRKSR